MSDGAEHRKFMQLAIEEMNKSRSEHMGKSDPLVGAVLVGSDGIVLGCAHRGEMRTGDHAEYTLLERKLRDVSTEKATLYVTLEPCSKRNPGKTPCMERVVSARISRVFIGMLDPNPLIQGNGVRFLQENSITVDFFDLASNKKIREANAEFIAQFNKEDPADSDLDTRFEGTSHLEREIVASARREQLSLPLLEKFVEKLGRKVVVPSGEFWELLHHRGYLTEKDGSLLPTRAGLLLFGKHPEDFQPNSKVQFEISIGDKKILPDLVGPLLEMPEKIEKVLRENIRSFDEFDGFARTKKSEYPIRALREAVINALAHRAYEDGTRVQIKLLENRIEIWSPGRLLLPLTLERIQDFNAVPYSRNPVIADALNTMGLMEERGNGLAWMRDEMTKHGLRSPEFKYEAGYFIVIFYGASQSKAEASIASFEPLSPKQEKILKYVNDHGSISSAQCGKLLKVSERTANNELKSLEGLGQLLRSGKGRSTVFVLKKTP